MRNKTFIISVLLIAGIILSGCGDKSATTDKTEDSKNKKETVNIYTTIYPLEDFTKKIGGDFVQVKSILPPNVNAHNFEPTSKDMIKLANSDLFIYTGAGVEGFADTVTQSLKSENVMIVKAADNIELIEVKDKHDHEEGHKEGSAHQHNHENEHSKSSAQESEEHIHGDKDPHVWLDPRLSIQLAENIKNALIEKMPEQKDTFQSNFNDLKKNLEQLDDEFKQTVQNSKTKYLLVSHAAYGYWENRYGIEQIAIGGLSPSIEPSQKELQEIIEESKAHGLHYIMFEQNVSAKVTEIIQKEIGAKSLILNNLESMTKEDKDRNEDYFSMMRKNLESIKTALND